MRIGVVNEETWVFFQEVFEEFERNHRTETFRRRQIASPVFNRWATDYFFHRDLTGFLKRQDVVFFEWASELLAYVSKLPKVGGIVTRLHRYEMYVWADKINWNAVDRIILVSEAKKTEFIKRFPDQSHKIVIIPEAISQNQYTPRIKEFNGDIGILCHLTPRKRVYELILAFYELGKLRDGLTLHIGGGRHPRFGDYDDALHYLVAELNLEKKVIFYGAVTNPQEWYSNIDIFVSNSYSEGLQVSPMEAAACGCYCISHHWDGADELFPIENLYFTEQQLKARILDYVDAKEAQRRVEVERLQRRVRERFDMDRIKVRIREVVEEVGESASLDA